ncbi:uncharacterized protein B0I36DRAFT_366624 [Microdochium trichocladiopsis]|uniref:MACPF-like domain-containing protein n=1 Tax=Microdochium trichocladiopsis TaxID=1682393 RepID=A0A9P8XZW3_9PEZI|nr:uncharacterized protein B0I36DRAFT_366624 [Microdochium trichocladiopsis]KAH7024703.1 hypothetical protein B0I36DRAFT_366624 [Microdochium trichocladiopsis]
MAETNTAAWPRFQLVLVSKDGTVFPSFPSSAFAGGDADKIRLADIRTRAAISAKLKFTAEGSAFVGDETTLSYYMSLRGVDIRSQKDDLESSEKTSAEIPTVKIELILNGFKATPTAPAVSPAKYQEEIEKLLVVDQSGAAKVGDLKKLSSTLDSLRSDSMVITAAASVPSEFTKEPLDLTEGQWDYVLRNTRALHGWYNRGNVMMKARKKAFDIAPPLGAAGETPNGVSNDKGVVLPLPPFYISDDATVDVTETRSALEREMADSGFSQQAIKASGGGGTMGVLATAAAAYEKQSSEAAKTIEASTVQAVHVAYKFPRATIELDAYSLQLTTEAKSRALGVSTVADMDRWYRDFGNVFALQFTLGGELTSSRLFDSHDNSSLASFKDSIKLAAGLSISSPYVTAGFSTSSVDATEHAEGEKTTNQNLRLTWKARGGNTLLCSNPPLWTATVKDYRLWRIMDQQCLVSMSNLVGEVDIRAAEHLTHPEAWTGDNGSSSDGAADDSDRERLWSALYDVFNNAGGHPLASRIQEFYNSAAFDLTQYNQALGPGERELSLKTKLPWSKLDLEHKTCVGILARKMGIINI